MRSPAAAAALALLTLTAAAAPAAAQVVVDPDSPSAKEYAIPLESERRQADPDAPQQDGVAPGERSSPLFGAGIEEQPTRADGDRERGGDGAGGGAEDDGGIGGTAGPADTPEVVRAATADPGAPDGGIGTGLAIAGVALVVVALGGGAGLLLRRRG